MQGGSKIPAFVIAISRLKRSDILGWLCTMSVATPPHCTIAAQPSTQTWRIIIDVKGICWISATLRLIGLLTSPSTVSRNFVECGVKSNVLISKASGSIALGGNSGTGFWDWTGLLPVDWVVQRFSLQHLRTEMSHSHLTASSCWKIQRAVEIGGVATSDGDLNRMHRNLYQKLTESDVDLPP